MIKTVKGKVIAGTVAVTLLAGSGVAFGAATDVGRNLITWYEGQFGKAGQAITTNVARDAASKAQGWATEYEGIKTAATNSINGTKTSEFSETSGAINTEKQKYINAVNSQKDVISKEMEKKFNDISITFQAQIEQAGKLALSSATTDLTTHTGTKGTEALTSLTADLNGVTDQAKLDLLAAIKAAKDSLNLELRKETSATTAEIIDMIDAKINELRPLINAKKEELVVIQQGLITTKAQELETAAKDDLQEIVDGI
ncbi:hypothetical protein [Psychrobacillus sp. OK032]|uniref:hypothetical protein n=1 Tax=Psychrobacillus sp. OK032 TaxID=1884358 RepID=UPI0008AF0906|nr:hypothetical protein [Psychrobacillus sp. OK032]SES30930.1 hypothetical protein SAMN05518872_107237 [Psychrobacillus sp. OK032]